MNVQSFKVQTSRRNWVFAAIVASLLLTPLVRPVAAAQSYVVQAGDTLTAIALAHGLSVDEIAQSNGIGNPDLIVTGQQLTIPNGVVDTVTSSEPQSPPPSVGGGEPVYVVQGGDTLSGIASELGVSVAALVEANGITNPDLIVTGQSLVLPASPAPVTSGAEPVVYVDYESVRSMIYDAAVIHREDPYLMMALAWRESGWQQHVVSSAGALGIMQLMPDTAAWAGPALVGRQVDPANSAWDNIETGVAFYAHLYSMTGSDYYALAGYYQGPYSVETQGLFGETEDYVTNVLDMRDLFAAGRLP